MQHSNQQMQECITDCSDCHDSCIANAAHAMRSGMEEAHVRLLHDCAQICDTARDYMLRGSPLHAEVCGVCAEVCRQCASMCEQHDDQRMKECADICQRAARSCAEVAHGGAGRSAMAA